MKTVILIPAHNVDKVVAEVINNVESLGFPVIVVDDGSDDNTYESAKSTGAIVLRHEKNLGKGAALRAGFDYILNPSTGSGFDAVITMDSDGQHDPALLNDFIKNAESNNSAFISGNRMHNTAAMPGIRVFTNRLTSWVLSKKIGQHVPDTQCGYRFIKKDLLVKIRLRTSHYEIESEMLIQAARAGARIDSIPVSSIYAGHNSRINPFVDTFRFIRLILTL